MDGDSSSMTMGQRPPARRGVSSRPNTSCGEHHGVEKQLTKMNEASEHNGHAGNVGTTVHCSLVTSKSTADTACSTPQGPATHLRLDADDG